MSAVFARMLWCQSCALSLRGYQCAMLAGALGMAGMAGMASAAQPLDTTGHLAAPSLQTVQLGLSVAPGMRPEQLLLALRQRGLVASNHAQCQKLTQDIQRLRRTMRRGEPIAHSEAQDELDIALARQTHLKCAPERKL